MRYVGLPIVISFLLFSSAFAAPTVSCHCFQDRLYVPQKSAAADPYFLATTQNSLMAQLFKIDKKSLVRAKMSGSDGDSLWITHSLARKSGKTTAEIEQVRSRSRGWSEAVANLKIDTDKLDRHIVALLGKPAELASFLVDELLVGKLGVEMAQLEKLRALGASDKERILSVLLALTGGFEPVDSFYRYQQGESWGKQLHDQGLFDGAVIERKWSSLLTD